MAMQDLTTGALLKAFVRQRLSGPIAVNDPQAIIRSYGTTPEAVDALCADIVLSAPPNAKPADFARFAFLAGLAVSSNGRKE